MGKAKAPGRGAKVGLRLASANFLLAISHSEAVSKLRVRLVLSVRDVLYWPTGTAAGIPSARGLGRRFAI